MIPEHFPSQPQGLWSYFHQLTQLPRPSKHESKVREFLIKEAILLTIRDNIPVERILQCYMEENEEVEIQNEVPTESKDNVSTTDIALEKPKTSDIPVDISNNPISMMSAGSISPCVT